MTDFKVTDEIFPLKDIRVRGRVTKFIRMYEENATAINKRLYQLRDDVGTIKYGANASFWLEYWNAGVHQGGASQLRWIIRNGKRIIITQPVIKTITNSNAKSMAITEFLKRLFHMPHQYELFVEAEAKRIALNSRSKSNNQILNSLREIQSAYNAEDIKRELQKIIN